MKRTAALLALVFCAFMSFATAQTTTVTSASGGLKINGNPVNGTVRISAQVPVAVSGGGLVLQSASSGYVTQCSVASGAITGTCTVPSSALSNGGNGVLYSVLVTDAFAGKAMLLGNVSISGASWALDQYVPPSTVTTAAAFTYTTGSGAPGGGCSSTSIYADTSGSSLAFYGCKGGSWVTVGTAAGNVTLGAITALGKLTNSISGNADTATTATAAGTAAMATAFAASPTPCPGSQLAGGVDVHGNAVNCASASGITSATSSIVNVPAYEYQNSVKPALVPFTQALQNAATTPVNIVVIGDSYSICDWTNCSIGPQVSKNRWPEQIRIALQAKYGSHGTGIVPINQGQNVVNSEAWTISGTTDWSTSSLGPTQTGMTALLHLSNGATATFNDSRGISWNLLRVYCMTNSGSGSIAISIDSGAYTGTACNTTTGSATAHVVTLAAGTAATAHSVTFTSTGNSYIYAAEGVAGTSGVSVSNLAMGGSSAENWGAAPSTQLAFSDIDPDGTQLAVVMLMANDTVLSGDTPTVFGTDMGNIITHEQTLTAPPSVMLAIPPDSEFDTTGSIMAPYTAQQLNLCATDNIACVNIQDHGTTINGTKYGFGPLYNSASAYLWDQVHSAGSHPTDAGTLDEASLIYSQMMGLGASNAIGGIAQSATTSAGHQYLMCSSSCTVSADGATDFVDVNDSAAATITLPSYSANPSGDASAGPTHPVTVSCLANSTANCTVAVPSSWWLYGTSGYTQNGTVVLTPGQSSTFQWYSVTGGATNSWFLVVPPPATATAAPGHEYVFCTSSCTVAQGTDIALANYSSAATVTLPNYSPNPSGDSGAGPGYTVDVSCLAASTASCTVGVPSSWWLWTTSGFTQNGTLTLSQGHSARFAWYSVTGGSQNNWMLIGSN